VVPAHLLLKQLQIISFSRKDMTDTLLLVKAHTVAEKEEPEVISADRVAHVLSRDWGFWYSATTNLRGIKEYVKKMTVLSPQELSELIAKVDQILSSISSTPKSLRWRLRAVAGTKKKWYNPVETEETVGGFGIWRLRNEAQP